MANALLVEDDADFAQRVTERLLHHGLDVTHVANAAEAQGAMVRSRFRFVLIDLMLPPTFDREGLEVLRGALTHQGDATILLMTARDRGTVSIVSEAMELGARTFLDKTNDLVVDQLMAEIAKAEAEARRGVFISHGHNDLLKFKLKDFVSNQLGRRAIVLSEQPSAGMTVVEKLEKVSTECSFAVILMTLDDEQAKGSLRARQNVVHELGFFQGRYGRRNVVLMIEKSVETFSNISVIVCIEFEANHFEAAFESLRLEISSPT